MRDGDGNTIAVIQAINKLKGIFSQDDQTVLEKLTMLAGVTLRNSQLFEDAKVQQRKTRSVVELVSPKPPEFTHRPHHRPCGNTPVLLVTRCGVSATSVVAGARDVFEHGTKLRHLQHHPALPRACRCGRLHSLPGGAALGPWPMQTRPARIWLEAAGCCLSRPGTAQVDKKRKELWSVATESGREFRIPLDAGLAGFVATSGEIVNIPGQRMSITFVIAATAALHCSPPGLPA